MILVTGATGLVGSHLLLQLLTQGEKVRAIYRSEAKIEQLAQCSLFKNNRPLLEQVEWYKADVRDIPSLEPVFVGVEQVYHCAALISFNPKDYKTLRNINIEGTANVVNLSIANKVTKLCYVSSVAALGEENAQGVIDETCFWNPETDHDVYGITKYGAEMEVWRASQEGVEVIIVNPGVIFGNGMFSKSMEVFTRIKQGFPFYTMGGSGFVAVEDVVKAMLFLMKGTVKNERFILVSENMTYKDMFTDVALALQKKPPHIKIGKGMLRFFEVMDWCKGIVTFGSRTFTKHAVNSISGVTIYDNAKIKGLGFTFEPMVQAINRYAKKY